MTSYLVISEEKELLEKKVGEICDEKKIDPFDRTLFEIATVETKGTQKKSWGIDDVKSIQKKILLKPLRGKWKAVILHDADLLTIEAQNALLKVLEEPPENTLFLLTASTMQPFLPTVLSRCTIIKLGRKQTLSEDEKEKILNEFYAVTTASLGAKLKKAESLGRSKEEVLSWIRQTLLALHESLPEATLADEVRTLKTLHEHYKIISQTNTNVRLATEHLLLSLT